MNGQKTKRMLSLLLAVVLVIGLLPATVLAAPVTLPEGMPLVSDKESTLAPGVTLHEIVSYTGDGERVEMYATIADLNVNTVQVFANYKDNKINEGWGFQTPADQAAAFEANHPGMQVVAATNGSYYNLTTGEPEGVLVMEGVKATKANDDSNNYPFFAILKDGTPYVGQAWTLNGMLDNVKEAVSGKRLLVWGGAACDLSGQYDYGDPDYKYPRNAIGITADKKVVMLLADGYRSPYSDGTTLDELAALMVELGCVAAVQLDGGGSGSLSTKPEGADKLELTSTPGDGGFARKVANSLVIVSTAAASDEFHHAALTAEHDYVTPGSTVGITVTGVSSTGHNADLPADTALQVKEAAMGSIVDGKYVGAAGYVGDAVIQAVSGGKVIGETTVHVVIPTKVNFAGEKMVVSYGNTADLVLEASINEGRTPVVIKASDFEFSWSDATLGTIEGFVFNSSEDTSLKSSVLTAKLVHDNNISDTVTVTLTDLPDKPVVITDFEDQVPLHVDPNGFYDSDDGWPKKYSYGIVDATTGKVHSGNYAFKLGLTICRDRTPFLQGYFTGRVAVGETNTVGNRDLTEVDLTNAQEFGMWIYIPEDSVIMSSAVTFVNSVTSQSLKVRLYDYGYASTEDGHTGWQYFGLNFDEINAANKVTFNDGNWYIQKLFFTECCSRRPDQYAYQYGYEPANHQSIDGYHEFYVDDIVIEYLDLDIDREDPNFGTVTMNYGDEKNVEVKGQTIASNKVSFSVQATDESKLDANSAKAYIDGNTVAVTCDANGTMTVDAQTLADGTHNITFVIADEHGNTDYVTRQVAVAAESDIPTVTIKGNENNGKDDEVLLESLFWLDVEVDNIEDVESITMKLNLDSASGWEFEGMELAYGFTAKHSVDVANNATITITKTGDVELEGHAVIAQIPVRVGDIYASYVGRDKTNTDWNNGALYWLPIDVRVVADQGQVTYADGTKTAFAMANIDCDSELTDWPYAWTGTGTTHKHSNVKTLEDKAATCTENGYTGRTFCEVCNSVVDWGTITPAYCHDYVMQRATGLIACDNDDCGQLFNGVFGDGKLYEEGALYTGWVDEINYYVDGEIVTGIYAVEDVYYDFGEDGALVGKVTGLFVDPADNKYSYALLGEMKTGWVLVDTDWHYFDENGDAVSGKVAVTDGVKFVFESNGKLTEGVWVKTDAGTRYYYGPEYYKAMGGTQTQYLFVTIDGKDYCFNPDGYRLEGIQYITKSTDKDRYWYDFGTDGVAKEFEYTGTYKHNGQLVFIDNGVSVYNRGMFEHEGEIYYVNSLFDVVTGVYHVVNPNGLLGGSGKYEFDENGKWIKDGVHYYASILTYLVDGVPTAAGVFYDEAEDCFYYARTGGKICTGEYKVPANRTNGLIPAGTYNFGEDGKLANNCENLGHKWVDATCTAPKTCSVCEATEGEALGHKWVDATCTAPKTCSVCEATEGEVVAHKWVDATCETAKTCSVCKATEGAPLGHVDENDDHKCDRDCGLTNMGECVDVIGDKNHDCDMCGKKNVTDHVYFEATCIVPKMCIDCGMTVGEALGHKWVDATCTEAKFCSVCDATEGEALGHKWVDATCTEPKTCSVCKVTEGEALGHEWEDATCTEPKTCSGCDATEGKALGHKWVDATCTEPKTCSVCEATEGEALGHKWVDATCTEPKTCSVCDATEGEALKHDMGDWVVTKEATSTEEGEKVRSCKYECGYEETEKIPVIEDTAEDGWNEKDGKWYFYVDGEKVTSEWILAGGKWYYLDAEGVMATGWVKVDGKWYLMSSGGHMLTGWQKSGGKWYYLKSEMKTGWQLIGGVWYYLDASGAMQTGWKLVNNKWYYMDANGIMQTYWEKVDGKWYYLGGDGAMRRGWQKVSGIWYYLNNEMKTGWQLVSGTWYYMDESGAMVTGTQSIDGKTYVFNENGAWIG